MSDFVNLGISADTIHPDNITYATINDATIILTRIKGQLYAVSNKCPHAGADLDAGSLRRGRIDCPDHGWRFDICTGRVLYPEDEYGRLKRYAVEVRNGEVWIES